VLTQIGWRPAQLEGGYKSYRRWVQQTLTESPSRFRFIVVCGLTGTGKSRLLQALAACGEQVLDLEVLAAHRGSLLGNLPAQAQPTQKQFDSDLLDILRHFDPARPVYVESESLRIGRLRLPEALAARMWESACVRVELAFEHRVALLKEEYPHFLDDVEALSALLEKLIPLHGKKRIASWQALARAGAWEDFVTALLIEHYDPAYLKSMRGHYPDFERAPSLSPRDGSSETLALLAKDIAAGLYANRVEE
jgi:tRNA 2-selenouridine synthase